jgi:hypothetical protein
MHGGAFQAPEDYQPLFCPEGSSNQGYAIE